MKIAIATDDREMIAVRTGHAKEIGIYDVENGSITNTTFLENHKGDHDHRAGHHHHSHKEVVAKMKGVDVFLVTHLGKHFRSDIIDAEIPFEIIQGIKINDIIMAYCNRSKL
jgi:predicted Fe-Mo cluster-binding NifX family protein